MKPKYGSQFQNYKSLYPFPKIKRFHSGALLQIRINLKGIESELKRRSLEENRAQALLDPVYADAVSVIESGKWDHLYEAQALMVERFLERDLRVYFTRALERSITRVLEVAKTCTSDGEFLALSMGKKNIFPPYVLQSYIHNDQDIINSWMNINPTQGRGSQYDLSGFQNNYKEAYEKAKRAKITYKANKQSAKWKEHIKTEVPDMPFDLIRRISGSPRDLTDQDKERLSEKGGGRSASDIAYEWAARLCGIPAYEIPLNTLKSELTRQNNQTNQQSRKSKSKTK